MYAIVEYVPEIHRRLEYAVETAIEKGVSLSRLLSGDDAIETRYGEENDTSTQS